MNCKELESEIAKTQKQMKKKRQQSLILKRQQSFVIV